MINVNFHSSSGVKILWNIDNWDCDLNSGVKCCLLKCGVIDVWNNTFVKLKEFIDTNKKSPSTISKNDDEKVLGSWLSQQQNSYKNMTFGTKYDCRCDEWSMFLEQYMKYIDIWNNTFVKLKEFIDTNKKTPSTISKNDDEKVLGSWLSQQQNSYKNRTRGMKNDERYDEWSLFIKQYNGYFDVWNNTLVKLKEFIDTNKKTPSTISKNDDEKVLSSWMRKQNQNYRDRIAGMKNDERYDEWCRFLEQYNELINKYHG